MKIFVVIPKEYAGCGYYRQYQPHAHLNKEEDVECIYSDGTHTEDNKLAVEADIIHFHKNYFSVPAALECKRAGIAIVVDFDDYWYLDTEHIFYQNYVRDGSTAGLINILKMADYVTVTTEKLAVEARKFTNNVVVLPNAFDPEQCEVERVKDDKLIFGYVGGHCHKKDVEQLRGVNNRLSQEFSNYKFRLIGYDGSPPYNHYASVMSGEGHLANTHFDWVEQADIWHYHNLYNHLDVALVPLVDNKFNNLKSELKLIEAGFFKKAVIVDNVHPYRDLIKHKENALVVNKYTDWYKHCKYLLNNPNAITDLGEALYETVQPYHIKEVNKKRLNFYKDVFKKRNADSRHRHSGVQSDNEFRLHGTARVPQNV